MEDAYVYTNRMQKTFIMMVKKGAIGVLPTDTIYGLVGSALSKRAVDRIYKIRDRNAKKPMIILIGSVRELSHFGVRPDARIGVLLKKLWPGPVSIILQCRSKKFEYLHRGTKTLAFRVPSDKWLQRLLIHTGPLVAPSANKEGKKPAITIQDAKKYFGGKVDFYIDAGAQHGNSSTVIQILR